MKKHFFLALVAIITVLASCQSKSGKRIAGKGPGVTVTATADTTLLIPVPRTAPRYACGTGARLKYDKYLGADTLNTEICKTDSVHITGDSLNRLGYVYRPGFRPAPVVPVGGGDEVTSGSNLSSWFLDLILALMLFACGIWVIWWLFTQKPTNTMTPAPTAPVVAQPTPVAPAPTPVVAPSPAENVASVTIENLKDLMTHMQTTGTTKLDALGIKLENPGKVRPKEESKGDSK